MKINYRWIILVINSIMYSSSMKIKLNPLYTITQGFTLFYNLKLKQATSV